jgi:hypothetical protein
MRPVVGGPEAKKCKGAVAKTRCERLDSGQARL